MGDRGGSSVSHLFVLWGFRFPVMASVAGNTAWGLRYWILAWHMALLNLGHTDHLRVIYVICPGGTKHWLHVRSIWNAFKIPTVKLYPIY